MKTIITTLLLLVSISGFGQDVHPRALRPSEIDPYAVYIFQRLTGFYTTVGGECAATAYFIIKKTGEWVEFPISCEDGKRWKCGMELNLDMPANGVN